MGATSFKANQAFQRQKLAEETESKHSKSIKFITYLSETDSSVLLMYLDQCLDFLRRVSKIPAWLHLDQDHRTHLEV